MLSVALSCAKSTGCRCAKKHLIGMWANFKFLLKSTSPMRLLSRATKVPLAWLSQELSTAVITYRPPLRLGFLIDSTRF